MKKIYMLVHEIKENKGGMTTAIFNRSKMFYENSIPADIITFDYNLEYKNIENKLKSIGKMDKRTKIYNMFSYFEEKEVKINRLKRNIKDYNNLLKQLKNCTIILNDKTSRRYFEKHTGEYLFFIRFDGKHIKHVDHFKNNKRTKRVIYNNKVKRVVEYFNENNQKINDIYFNELELPYLNRTINTVNKGVSNIYLINEQKKFNDNISLSKYYMEQLLDDRNNNILICDGPGSFPKMLAVEKKKTKKISVIHTNHFNYPYSIGSSIKKHEKYILDSANKIDEIVVLTEKQKEDILYEFKIENVSVIPNYQDLSRKSNKKIKSTGIIGHLSRLNKNKGFDRLLEVMNYVVKKDSSINLHIYGSGEYEKDIISLIEKYGLNNNVQLKGYVNQSKEVLSNFDITVSVSYFEAFGLSISESMEQEVPVVAMDINYGPSDLIENGKNGYLVQDGDIEGMGDRIIELIQNDKKRRGFGKNARMKVEEFLDPKTIMAKWNKII